MDPTCDDGSSPAAAPAVVPFAGDSCMQLLLAPRMNGPCADRSDHDHPQQRIKRQALAVGSQFTAGRLLRPSAVVVHPGFTQRTVPIDGELQYRLGIDPRAVVSLVQAAARCPRLTQYASKRPLLLINVARFAWTVEAFGLGPGCSERDAVTERALTFYLEADQASVSDQRHSAANERFSALLHRLRSSGYEAYILALARATGLHVDLIYGTVSRRMSRHYRNDVCVPARVGFITALTDDGETWSVRVTRGAIIPEPIIPLPGSTRR